MIWTNHIYDCRFMLDVAWITIVSDSPRKLVVQLGKYMATGVEKYESRTTNPIMPDIFKHRTYFSFGQLSEVYLLHEKISPAQGIDALLMIHDVSLISLLQIEQILNQISAVSDFHFCRIEFTWDFYPDQTISTPELQRNIIQRFHLTHARKAWPNSNKVFNDRTTYYINPRDSDLQGKVYIRPKKPDPTAMEFVRVELTAKTRWLKGIGLIKPSDFLGLKFQQIVHQVRWIEFDWHQLRRRSQFHLLSGGFWFANLLNDWQYLGISYCLSVYRAQIVCPSQCKYRGNPKHCRIFKAYNRPLAGSELILQMQNCQHAKAYPRFEEKFCKQSRHSQFLMNTMEQAYLNWNQPPSFLTKVTASASIPKKKTAKRPRRNPIKVPKGLSRLF